VGGGGGGGGGGEMRKEDQKGETRNNCKDCFLEKIGKKKGFSERGCEILFPIDGRERRKVREGNQAYLGEDEKGAEREERENLGAGGGLDLPNTSHIVRGNFFRRGAIMQIRKGRSSRGLKNGVCSGVLCEKAFIANGNGTGERKV